VPEEVRALRFAAGEAGAVDRICEAAHDRLDQGWHVLRVVLHVRVLDHGDLTGHVRDRGSYGGALPLVLLPEQEDAIVLGAPALDGVGGPVRRPVVHDDHLRLEVERVDSGEHLLDRAPLVVGGDEKGDAHQPGTISSRLARSAARDVPRRASGPRSR
jgi:hypothetical protein